MMRERKPRRWLSFLLAAVMLLSLLPMTVLATGTAENSSDPEYRVVHLDCGRKYFSVDNIKSIIDTASAAGFNYIELAVGNDGLRFLLDNMAITVDETTYSSADVTAAIQAANKEYYDAGDKNELTQAEMDTIIAYAVSKGMQVLPLLNTPGHMNAIVTAMATLGIDGDYDGSKNTIDITNATAVAFTKALVQKYVTYFAGQGCTVFNIGADEYANDIYSTGGMGFAQLVSAGQYGQFVTYVNDLATMVKTAGMKPMAFNDGIYYNSNTTTPIDTDILVAYWSNGWSGYNVATPSFLKDQGFKLINTNGDYYWVLGKDAQCSAEKAAQFDINIFPNRTNGTETVEGAAGAMFCIWCDVPGADTADNVVANTAATITAFGGALTSSSGSTDATDTTVKDETTGVSVTAPGLTGVTVAENTTAVVTIAGAANYKVYDIAPVTAEGAYAGEATVTLPVPETWTNVRGGVLASGGNEAVMGITGTLDSANGTFTFTVPHFSSVVVYDLGETQEKSITITAGTTATATIEGVNLTGTEAVIGDKTVVTNVTMTGTDEQEATTTYTPVTVTCNDLISSDSPSWQATGYYYAHSNGDYYPVYAQRSSNTFVLWTTYTYKWGYSTTDSASTVIQVGNEQTSSNPSTTTANISVCRQSTTAAVPASTTVTFTAAADAAGKSTTVTIGNVVYTVNVVAEDLSSVTPLTIEYWITNARVTGSDGNTSIDVTAAQAYGENGVAISGLVPMNAIKSGEGYPTVYWKARRLPYGNHQTGDNGVDKTTVAAGTDITHIRYLDGNWQYSADGGANWVTIQSTDQIVAYYLQVTDVTQEVTTQVVDYGSVYKNWDDLNYLETSYVLLDYSVVYESGEEVPSAFPTANSLGFHCVDSSGAAQYRTLGMIRAEETAEYEVYMITLTPTADAENSRLSGSTAAGNTSYSYNGTEVVAWAATQADLEASGLGTWTSISGAYTYSIGGEPIVPGLEIYRQHGMKVTYYVRAKVTEDSLTVNYINQDTNATFYSYNIAVPSTTNFRNTANGETITFDPNYIDIKNALSNNTVVNINEREQTVSADLGTLPQINTLYQNVAFNCVDMTISEDGKTVNLYYTFPSNTRNFVIDFGLPLTLSRNDLGIAADATVSTASLSKPNFGTVVGNSADNTLTYTPTSVLTSADMFTMTLNDVTYIINIIPASNVLYEAEDFLTVNNTMGTSYKPWNAPAEGDTATQAADNSTLYGYDTAYAQSTGNSMSSAWTFDATEATGYNSASQYLTTTFTGNAFDLIGTAGPDTGYVYLVIQGPVNKVVIVDTTYTGGTLSQVPLAHVELGLEGTYTVTIRAAYRAATAGVSTKAATAATAAMGVNAVSASDSLTETLTQAYASGVTADQVEVLSFEETQGDIPAGLADAVPAVAAYEARSAAPGNTVTIDGFRVYRTTGDSGYSDNTHGEYNATYTNVLDAFDGNFTAYGETADGTWSSREGYEGPAAGGPQNEVYLANGDAIAFKVNANATVQISARAVSGTPVTLVVNGETVENIYSNTEMYYKVTAGSDGIITVKTNSTDGMLALGNLKLPAGTSTQTLSEYEATVTVPMLLSRTSAPAEEPEPEVPDTPTTPDPETPVTPDPEPSVPVVPSVPETFDPTVELSLRKSNLIFTRMFTLTVTASTDVAKLTVNGKEVKPLNSLLVQWGLSDEYVYVVMETAGMKETRTYEVVAYGADGSSQTYTITG